MTLWIVTYKYDVGPQWCHDLNAWGPSPRPGPIRNRNSTLCAKLLRYTSTQGEIPIGTSISMPTSLTNIDTHLAATNVPIRCRILVYRSRLSCSLSRGSTMQVWWPSIGYCTRRIHNESRCQSLRTATGSRGLRFRDGIRDCSSQGQQVMLRWNSELMFKKVSHCIHSRAKGKKSLTRDRRRLGAYPVALEVSDYLLLK